MRAARDSDLRSHALLRSLCRCPRPSARSSSRRPCLNRPLYEPPPPKRNSLALQQNVTTSAAQVHEPVYAFVEATGEGERSEFNEVVKRLDVLHTEYVHKQVRSARHGALKTVNLF